MYVLEGEYLAEVTVFAGLLWFRGYPDLCQTFLVEQRSVLSARPPKFRYLPVSLIGRQQ